MGYQAGDTVNQRYEILESLGHGGMSDAYKARDRQSGHLVVVKVPFISLIGDPATFSRYQREVEITESTRPCPRISRASRVSTWSPPR
jgi:serine/threonine protein kinase